MRSHFLPPQGIAATCAIAGALSMLPRSCPAQSFIAADFATNSTYASSGWIAGQNGGHGFGPWSFDGTDPTPAGIYQGMSTSSPIGTSWTLLKHANTSGLANAGRAISQPGGLQPGQTLEVVMANPTGYSFFRGFDVEFMNSTTNNPGGVNRFAFRAQVFDYYIQPAYWDLIDGSPGDTPLTQLDVNTTAAAGMKLDFTLITTNTYSVTLTPLSNPSAAVTSSGPLTTNLPINWIDFRNYNTASSGLDDATNNFAISSLTISGPTLKIQQVGNNVVLSWLGALTNFALVSSPNLGPTAVWSSVSPPPAIVNGQNAVTNSILDAAHQFYRLQLQQ
jgi:hypothetical protein